VPVCGLCGGYQMLGRELHDPEHTESTRDELPGLGLLDVVTTFAADKVLAQARGRLCAAGPLLGQSTGQEVAGYEIHMGRTVLGPEADPFLAVTQRGGQPDSGDDGAVSATGLIWGTYIHGIFDNDHFRAGLLGRLRRRRGLDELAGQGLSSQALLDQELDRLAAEARACLDLKTIYALLGLSGRREEQG
jgi:adenosylcobyric acid synthase